VGADSVEGSNTDTEVAVGVAAAGTAVDCCFDTEVEAVELEAGGQKRSSPQSWPEKEQGQE